MAQNIVGKHLENCHQAGSRYNPTNNVLNLHTQRFDCLSLPFLGLWELLTSNTFKRRQVGLGLLLLHTWAVNVSCISISLLLPFYVLFYGFGLLQHLSVDLAASSISETKIQCWAGEDQARQQVIEVPKLEVKCFLTYVPLADQLIVNICALDFSFTSSKIYIHTHTHIHIWVRLYFCTTKSLFFLFLCCSTSSSNDPCIQTTTLFQAKRSHNKVTWRHLCTFWRCMQVEKHSCINYIYRAEYTALKWCTDSTSGSQNYCSLSVKSEFRDCMLQNQQENFRSPASHVAIFQKLAQELKEIKHYHFVHDFEESCMGKRVLTPSGSLEVCWICLTTSERVFFCVFRDSLTHVKPLLHIALQSTLGEKRNSATWCGRYKRR